MSKVAKRMGLGTLVGCALSQPAHAGIVLSFDEFPSGTVIAAQYSEFAVFSSSAGNENYAIEFANAVTHPNILCSGQSGTPNCLEDTYVDFPVPLEHLQLAAIIQNSATGNIAQFNLFEDGVLTTTRHLVGLGQPGNVLVEFLGYKNITRLEILNITAPTGWDNFGLAQVPEPSSLSVLAVGVPILALLSRRKRRQVAG
jgi:hypothetical protein